MPRPPLSPGRRVGAAAAAPLLATALWLGALHWWFTPDLDRFRSEEGVAPEAQAMALRYEQLWLDPAIRDGEHDAIRFTNPEWDFMGRTYMVLALANMALREPAEEERYLAVIDAAIDDTLALERRHGQTYFLMDYASWAPFEVQPARSVFVDGEIALMIAARRMVADDERLAREHRARVDEIAARMELSPVRSVESYPDECWTFCNTLALASIALGDRLDGTDHAALLDRWMAVARERLIDPDTGLLVSSYTLDGRPLDGPEGSSIFMAAHALQLVDPAFAADQYRRAREELGIDVVGFGFAREWPRSWQGPVDIDSGPTVPLLGANAGSSGQALVGAAAFGDDETLARLLASLRLAGFPARRGEARTFAASNHVGDAVILYALVQGPLWERATLPEAVVEVTR